MPSFMPVRRSPRIGVSFGQGQVYVADVPANPALQLTWQLSPLASSSAQKPNSSESSAQTASLLERPSWQSGAQAFEYMQSEDSPPRTMAARLLHAATVAARDSIIDVGNPTIVTDGTPGSNPTTVGARSAFRPKAQTWS